MVEPNVNFIIHRAPKEHYQIIMDCLESMEKKVDAAFGNYHVGPQEGR